MPGKLDVLPFPEQLAYMVVVTVGVGRLGQGDDPLPHIGSEGMRGDTPTGTMDQCCGARVLIRRPEAVDVPHRTPHACCFCHRRNATLDLVQAQQPSLLLAVHCHCLLHA